MSTNAGIVSNALKYVTEQKEQLSLLQKVDERIEEIKEEAEDADKSISGIF